MSKTLLVPERYAKAAQRSAEKETSPDKIKVELSHYYNIKQIKNIIIFHEHTNDH